MRFSYLVNLDDFKEAVQSKSPLGKPARPGFVLLNGLFVFGICLVSALPRTQFYTRWELRDLSRRNLWVTLAPSLCIITFLSTGSILQKLRKALVGRGRKNSALTNTLQVVSQFQVLLCLVWVLVANVPQFEIGWHPSEGEKIYAALAPWALYFAVVGYLASRKRGMRLNGFGQKRCRCTVCSTLR
jgi:hypothetical protein